ncbi:MAG: family 78 glycoside hydrolase catalytic domain, partial [Clostridia bacterium]|nr:family 78 glycoside hydrolase catalytic domain [Clostridia bacterium]
MKYNEAIWHKAKFIYTDFEGYQVGNEKVWEVPSEDFIKLQHMDFPSWVGTPTFIKDFELGDFKCAKLLISALGCIDIYINGERVGDDELKPGWTNYHKRTFYIEYDVTDKLLKGKNRILIVAASGWYSGRISGGYYGNNPPAVMACLTADGADVAVTDIDWKAKNAGQILNSDLWDGEFFDARETSYAEMSSVSFDASSWDTAKSAEYFDGEVTPFIGTQVRVRDNLSKKAKSVTVYDGIKDNSTRFGEINVISNSDKLPVSVGKGQGVIIDMGQELTGWAKIKIKAARGTEIKVRYAEMLNDSGDIERGNDGPKGSVYTINYRTALSKMHYIASGNGEEVYRPTFTFTAFRYVEITADGEFELLDYTGEVVGSDNRETGHIETSDESVNKLISNIIWGQRSNYLSVPTDCPQRNERLGWTGDAQAFSMTAAYNADINEFFRKWLQDMRDSQGPNGEYTDVVPSVSFCQSANAAAWADAGIIIPYNLYKIFGDITIIEEHYDSMEKYISQFENKLSGPEPRYGDWLAYDYCKNEYISSAFLVHDLDLMTEMSEFLGKNDRAEYYREFRKRAYAYFFENFTDNGKLLGETQSERVIALAFDLLDGEDAERASHELVSKIKENGNRLSTGFVGTYNLCPTLSKIGADSMAYTLLLQHEEPSWLYSVDQGATTVWERWNSYTK